MAADLTDLLSWCDDELNVRRFNDYCPNGLQVQGRPRIARLAAAVTANQAVLDEAVDWGADALLVHHGYFWRGEDSVVTGMKRRRLATLLAADMSLIAYHLPLDAHGTLGNNAQWGDKLGLGSGEPLHPEDPAAVGNIATLSEAVTIDELMTRIRALTAREPLLIGEEARRVSRVAWCTGAAQSYIDRAAAAGAELFISGEISEPTVHAARELGIAYLAAGHHATERYGVQALAACMSERFGLEWQFIDCDNPV